jgi:hypothetical protein
MRSQQMALIATALVVSVLLTSTAATYADDELATVEAKAIAKQGYILGLPLVYIVYDQESYLVDKPLSRCAIDGRNNLNFGDVGSLTVYIQDDNADQEANWRPMLEPGLFRSALRLCIPKTEIADGTWKPPAVV